MSYPARPMTLAIIMALITTQTWSEPPACEDKPKEGQPKQVRTDLYGDPLPPGAIMRLGTTRLRHQSLVRSVTFSPNGKILASTGYDHTVRLWDAATGKELHRFPASTHGVVFSADSKLIAVSGAGESRSDLYVCDVDSGKVLLSQARVPGFPVRFSADGKALLLAVSGPRDERSLQLWDVASGEELSRLDFEGKFYYTSTLSPDGKTLASGGNPDAPGSEGTIYLWDVETGKPIRQLRGHGEAAVSIRFSPDGKTLASADTRGVVIWDVMIGQPICQLKESAMAVAFSPDGTMLAWGSGAQGFILLRDLATGKTFRIFEGHGSGVNSLAFAPDGKTLASASHDRTIRLWNVHNRQEKEIHKFPGHRYHVRCVAYSPNGKLLASGGGDNVVCIWDVAMGKETCRFELPWSPLQHNDYHAHGCSSLAFFPDGRRLAVAGGFTMAKGYLSIWEVMTGKELLVLEGHEERITCVSVSPDGKLVASSSFDGTIRLWNPATGEQVRELRQIPFSPKPQFVSPRCTCVAFSPDGKTLASAGNKTVKGEPQGGEICLWEVTTGKEICRLHDPDGIVNALAFSPDGKILASTKSRLKGDIQVWDVEKKQLRFKVPLPNNGSISIDFLHDGETLVSAGHDDGSIQFWNLNTGKKVGQLRGHEIGIVSGIRIAVFTIAVSPDGKALASGGLDTTILIWDLSARKP